jgi:hypothetical protein
MPKKIHLEQIANIRSGFSVRSKAELNPGISYPILQISDFDVSTHSLQLPISNRVSTTAKVQTHFLDPNDIVFLAKGSRHLCFMPGNLDEPTLAADSFFVISPKPGTLPAYLTWYLNLPATQHILERDAGGSRIPIIRIDALKSLSIPIPPLATQEKIARLVELRHREKSALIKLADLRERQINQFTQTLSQS